MRKKQTCHDCRAAKSASCGIYWTHEAGCDLGYPVEERKVVLKSGTKISRPVPLEICPKPRTYDAYLDCLARIKEEA